MSKRTREAERLFGDALRAPRAFEVKATPDYKALARSRKTERAWLKAALALDALFVALVILERMQVI